MKKLFAHLLLMAISASFMLVSCSKEDSEPQMKAKIDGSDWTALVRTATLSQSQNVIVITGFPNLSQSAEKSIIITIKGTTKGTYQLSAYVDELSGDCMIVYKTSDNAAPGSASYYNSYSATVTITDIDTSKKRISGTFVADMYPNGDPTGTKIVISDGKFQNLLYTEIN